MEVVSYTRGRGHLSLPMDGYRPCKNAQEVIAESGYQPEHDLDNPEDSVFCAHGAGFVAVSYTHLDVYKRQGGNGGTFYSCQILYAGRGLHY